jgi:hypothetical protein
VSWDQFHGSDGGQLYSELDGFGQPRQEDHFTKPEETMVRACLISHKRQHLWAKKN